MRRVDCVIGLCADFRGCSGSISPPTMEEAQVREVAAPRHRFRWEGRYTQHINISGFSVGRLQCLALLLASLFVDPHPPQSSELDTASSRGTRTAGALSPSQHRPTVSGVPSTPKAGLRSRRFDGWPGYVYHKCISACFAHHVGISGPNRVADASGIQILSTSLPQDRKTYMTIFHSSDKETNDSTGCVLVEAL